jgi:hypothetical protein
MWLDWLQTRWGDGLLFSATVQDIVPCSREGFLDYLVAFIVTSDQVGCTAQLFHLTEGGGHVSQLGLFYQPFSIVDQPYFRALLKSRHPDMKEMDIPHRTKIAEMVVATAKYVQQRTKERYRVRRCLID